MESRVEIDTRAPFQSVKEAILLFGERVLAQEIHANKIKEMKMKPVEAGNGYSKLVCAAAELEETKKKLKKSREETWAMFECLNSLIEELAETKKQLENLKRRRPHDNQKEEREITEVGFVEETKLNYTELEHSRKKCIAFVDPPSLAEVLRSDVTASSIRKEQVHFTHSTSNNNKKNPHMKKPLIPLIGGIFSKRKVSEKISSPAN